jgi:hypothetical protein
MKRFVFLATLAAATLATVLASQAQAQGYAIPGGYNLILPSGQSGSAIPNAAGGYNLVLPNGQSGSATPAQGGGYNLVLPNGRLGSAIPTQGGGYNLIY